MSAKVQVGELVSAVEPGGTELAGLVVEIRRSDCRVLDLDADRSYWFPLTHLRRGARSIRKGSTTSILSSLVLHLDASQLEVERGEGGQVRARIACAGLDAEGVDRIREYFGSSLRGLRIQPAGLAKLHLVVEFLPSPPRSGH